MRQGFTDELAEALVIAARELRAEDTPEKVQEQVTRAAVNTVRGCGHAAISRIHRDGGIETVGATDEVPLRVDAIQYEVGQGPCLDAIAEHLARALPPTG